MDSEQGTSDDTRRQYYLVGMTTENSASISLDRYKK